MGRAKQLRKNATPQEQKLWYRFLRYCTPGVRRQRPFENYILDFYCAELKLCIELDGGQHFEAANVEYDQKRTKAIESQGIKVVRFSNTEIDKEFAAVCQALLQLGLQHSFPTGF